MLFRSILAAAGILTVVAVVATGGTAIPLVAAGYATLATAGTVATAIGTSEIYESFTGENPVREFTGDELYDTLTYGSAMVMSMGGMVINAGTSLSNTSDSSGYVSRGSTATRQPSNLTEKLALEQVRSNPQGSRIPINMNDPRWPASEGWVKMSQNVPTFYGNVEVHYVYNTIIGVFDDFKLK